MQKPGKPDSTRCWWRPCPRYWIPQLFLYLSLLGCFPILQLSYAFPNLSLADGIAVETFLLALHIHLQFQLQTSFGFPHSVSSCPDNVSIVALVASPHFYFTCVCFVWGQSVRSPMYSQLASCCACWFLACWKGLFLCSKKRVQEGAWLSWAPLQLPQGILLTILSASSLVSWVQGL